jgi:hypothetical protein
MSRQQWTIFGKYAIVNRAIPIWNQLPVNNLWALSCKEINFRKRVRKVMRQSKGVVEIIRKLR